MSSCCLGGLYNVTTRWRNKVTATFRIQGGSQPWNGLPWVEDPCIGSRCLSLLWRAPLHWHSAGGVRGVLPGHSPPSLHQHDSHDRWGGQFGLWKIQIFLREGRDDQRRDGTILTVWRSGRNPQNCSGLVHFNMDYWQRSMMWLIPAKTSGDEHMISSVISIWDLFLLRQGSSKERTSQSFYFILIFYYGSLDFPVYSDFRENYVQ